LAWFDVFKKPTPADTTPGLRDPEQILAYLECLFRLGSELLMHLPGDTLAPYPVVLDQISEGKGTFTIRLRKQPPREPGKGMPTEFWFNLDGLRFLARAECLGRPSPLKNEFRLPECISHAERRGGGRARFNLRERTQVLALESIFEGTGLSGKLLNLGRGGCAFRVEKAIDVRTDKKLAPSTSLVRPGKELGLIRLKEIPNIPLLDLRGVVSHCETRSEGLVVGLAFTSLNGSEAQAIDRLLVARVPKVVPGFTWKRRRAEEDPPEEGSAEVGVAPESAVPPEPSPVEEEPAPPPEPPAKVLSEAETQRLLRRCSRQILLVVEGDLEREFLAARLRAEGFRGIHEARGWLPAAHKTRKVALDLILMNQQVGPNSALEIIDSLRGNGLADEVRVVVLKQQEDVRLTLASKAGKLVLMPAQPEAFKEVLVPGLEALLGLSG
jgi:hypothetical protein